MPTEMGGEAVEIITMAVDKFQANKNYEVSSSNENEHWSLQALTSFCCVIQASAQLIKNTMDKKFGLTWHCVVGEGFGFEITCQRKYLLHIYYGKAGILCYKC